MDGWMDHEKKKKARKTKESLSLEVVTDKNEEQHVVGHDVKRK